ncbi:MAG: glycerophosphodiester phosphodiesterase family protein [Propioniciclava sp.]
MFGDPTHSAVNGLLSQLHEGARPLVVSHAGVAVGSTPPNTIAAVQAARLSGADLVKIDVSSSVDNIFYAFHDGFEEEHLGETRNLQALTAAEIGRLTYHWKDRPGHRAPVERLATLLTAFRQERLVFALDRSWWRWPTLLRVLDGLQMVEQLLVKVPSWERAAIETLRQHKTPYPTLAICSTPQELSALPLKDRGVNLVGVELIAHDNESPWLDPAIIEGIQRSGLMVWVNSETLTTGISLFGDYDDATCVADGPAAAWSTLLELGVDAIQTELPWLLHDYRSNQAREA